MLKLLRTSGEHTETTIFCHYLIRFWPLASSCSPHGDERRGGVSGANAPESNSAPFVRFRHLSGKRQHILPAIDILVFDGKVKAALA